MSKPSFLKCRNAVIRLSQRNILPLKIFPALALITRGEISATPLLGNSNP